MSICAASAWIFAHWLVLEPKLCVESASGTISLDSVIDFVRLAMTEVAVITLEAKLPVSYTHLTLPTKA